MKKWNNKRKRQWSKIAIVSVIVFVIALLIEIFTLNYVGKKNAYRTTGAVLEQVINLLEKNQRSEDELIGSLKEDYMVRAQAVAYIIDAMPEVENDIEEMKKIAGFMSIDEIHLFDTTGTIYSGTVPKYYGLNMNSGVQIGYFKPMLEDKTLTMCHDVMPNTSEGKSMMYAMTWNKSGTMMIQVGIEPIRLFEALKNNKISDVVSGIPVYNGISVYISDAVTGEIYGSSDPYKIGWNMEDLGINLKDKNLDNTYSIQKVIDGYKNYGKFRRSDKYVVGVLFSTSANIRVFVATISVMLIYLTLSAVLIIFMIAKLFKANTQRDEQMAVLSSLAGIYYSMHVIDLEKNSVTEYSASDEVRELTSVEMQADHIMKTIIAQTVLPEFRDNALEFTDVLSVADRMTGKKIISGEFIGKNLGWFRASFITIETDEKQRPLKVLFTTRSIDEDKKKEEQLILFSNTDELTGCYNRRAYEEDMTELLSKDEFIYVSMDVNGLKTVNDSMGHEAGDELLRGAAECMNNTFDKYGKVYRNGGDEFVAILNVGRDKYGEISQSFENAINNWTGNSVKAMTISCGYVMGDERSWGSNLEVAKLADDRMYRIKTEYYKDLGIVRPERQNKYSVISKLYDIIERIELSENGIKKLMKDSQRIHPDDREKYMYKISLEYLRKYFSENNVLSIFYRVQTEDGYIPMVMDIIEADDYSEGAQSLYMYIRKCDDIRK